MSRKVPHPKKGDVVVQRDWCSVFISLAGTEREWPGGGEAAPKPVLLLPPTGHIVT